MGRIKVAVCDALTGEKVRQAIQAAVVNALTRATVVDALVAVLTYSDGSKQYLTDNAAPVAERIAAEYAANVQSATISALRN